MTYYKSCYLWIDVEFAHGRGTQVEKSWKFQGGSTVKPPGTENPRGGGVKLEKNLCGGMDIFWNHSLIVLSVLLYKI